MTVTGVDEQRGQAVKEEKEAVRGLGSVSWAMLRMCVSFHMSKGVAEHSPG